MSCFAWCTSQERIKRKSLKKSIKEYHEAKALGSFANISFRTGTFLSLKAKSSSYFSYVVFWISSFSSLYSIIYRPKFCNLMSHFLSLMFITNHFPLLSKFSLILRPKTDVYEILLQIIKIGYASLLVSLLHNFKIHWFSSICSQLPGGMFIIIVISNNTNKTNEHCDIQVHIHLWILFKNILLSNSIDVTITYQPLEFRLPTSCAKWVCTF